MTTYNDGGASSVVNSYLYNKRRLPVSETQQVDSLTSSVGYGYDVNGHLSALTYPDNLTVGYAPNALGQPMQAGTYATNVTYYPNGAIEQFTYGNGIVHTLTQNARGLPDVSQDAYGSTAIHQDEYAYDQVGNVLYITDAATGQSQRGNRSMVYDDLNRLKSATSPMFGSASYTYDVLDNLTHVTVTGGSQPRDQAYVYDASNRLTNITAGGATVVGLGYDVQGNLANKSGVAYTFDYGNRLRGVGNLEGYRYDVAGRRVLGWSPTTGSILSVYGHDGVLRFQQNQRNATNIDYVYLGGSLVATYSYPYATGVGTVKYQHTDALGSPVAVTDANRTVLQRSEYEPYGYLLNRPMEDGPGYTGHVTDAATGLVYMQQRYYDPLIQRFLSRDEVTAYQKPLTNFNAYVYALNNPYRFTDPDGRDVMVISGGLREGGFNWAGHVAAAIQGDGMSSYGNDTPRHSSVADYIRSQSELRPQQITIIPTTKAQDAAARETAATLPTKVTKLDNCAVRTNQILEAAGVDTSAVPLPKVTETVAAEQKGAITFQIPKGGEIPKALLDILPKFEAPKKEGQPLE